MRKITYHGAGVERGHVRFPRGEAQAKGDGSFAVLRTLFGGGGSGGRWLRMAQAWADRSVRPTLADRSVGATWAAYDAGGE